MTRLHDLYVAGGQSPWIDDLKRSYVAAGELEHLVDLGIRGVTSNPTIMAKAIEAGTDYDEQFFDLLASGASVEEAYWELVLYDVAGASRILQGVYGSAGGGDGFVSIEVSPSLAHNTEATITAALDLHARAARPNVLVKIPATLEGVPAIEEMIARGHSINVTLIFSLERYEAVIDAYQHGLERLIAAGGDPTNIASVASFFVSRVDTEVDRRLDAIAESDPDSAGATEALALRGKAAIAQARLAYQLFRERFDAARFTPLAAKGARTQRPLWASTSTKNPAYPDLLYVESLIGPDTVDTMPDQTVQALLDHGHIARTIDQSPEEARAVIDRLAEVGVDLEDVTRQLEQEGVSSFAKSFDEVTEKLTDKGAAFKGR
jgi:transaldolase